MLPFSSGEERPTRYVSAEHPHYLVRGRNRFQDKKLLIEREGGREGEMLIVQAFPWSVPEREGPLNSYRSKSNLQMTKSEAVTSNCAKKVFGKHSQVWIFLRVRNNGAVQTE